MRIIDKAKEKIKDIVNHPRFDDTMWVAIVCFVTMSAFSYGMIYERKANLERNPLLIRYNTEALALWEEYHSIKLENLEYFGSRNGSIVYPVGCAQGLRVKEENRIFFQNLQQALDLGYREARGC